MTYRLTTWIIFLLFVRIVVCDASRDEYSLQPAMLNYTDGRNYSYAPSWFVVGLHHMPHLNEYAIDHETNFKGGDNDEARAYYNSLLGKVFNFVYL